MSRKCPWDVVFSISRLTLLCQHNLLRMDRRCGRSTTPTQLLQTELLRQKWTVQSRKQIYKQIMFCCSWKCHRQKSPSSRERWPSRPLTCGTVGNLKDKVEYSHTGDHIFQPIKFKQFSSQLGMDHNIKLGGWIRTHKRLSCGRIHHKCPSLDVSLRSLNQNSTERDSAALRLSVNVGGHRTQPLIVI